VLPKVILRSIYTFIFISGGPCFGQYNKRGNSRFNVRSERGGFLVLLKGEFEMFNFVSGDEDVWAELGGLEIYPEGEGK